jgi:hypothetical protein
MSPVRRIVVSSGKKKGPRPKPERFGPLPEPEGSEEWYAEVRRRATVIREEAVQKRRFGGNPMPPEDVPDEFTCADCAYFDEEIRLCRLVQEHRPPEQTRCEGFTPEPLGNFGGSSSRDRTEDDWGLDGYATTRQYRG